MISMKTRNSYPFASDNKRYTTFTYYCNQTYGHKVVKIPLQAGFTCPNRDGSKSIGGCLFCSAYGSGEFNLAHQTPIVTQYQQAKLRYQKKWPTNHTMPYFQSFTNTYCSLEHLQSKVNALHPFSNEIDGYAFATRVDCISNDMLAYLTELNNQKDVWVELGLQTSNDATKVALNCMHTNNQALQTHRLLKQNGIKTVIHIINGLPNETADDMLATIDFVNQLQPTAVKFTMLHILDNAPLGQIYLNKPWSLLSMDEYLDILCCQLQHLNPQIVVERICGDGDQTHIIEPKWTNIKIQVMNELDKKMAKENIMQGELFKALDT